MASLSPLGRKCPVPHKSDLCHSAVTVQPSVGYDSSSSCAGGGGFLGRIGWSNLIGVSVANTIRFVQLERESNSRIIAWMIGK